MRKRSITIFLSVYAALCIAYGVGTSVIMPDNTDIIAAAGQESSQVTQKADEIPSSEPVAESSQENSSSKSSSTPVIENSTNNDIESVIQKANEYKTSEPSVIEASDIQQSEEQIEEDNGDEYAEEKPSLEEFLKSLRCSGCRHNCTLFSPRCMNGARKASQAQTQYYELYG